MHPAPADHLPPQAPREPLPLPPELPSPPKAAPDPPRRGQLSIAWRSVTVAAWAGVAVGFAAVWRTSWTMGLSTWWLGPESSPRFVLLLVLPFVAPLALVAATLRRVPWVPYWGMAAAVACALVGWGDLHRVPGLAAVELALAAGGLLVSVGSLSGLPRRARTQPEGAGGR